MGHTRLGSLLPKRWAGICYTINASYPSFWVSFSFTCSVPDNSSLFWGWHVLLRHLADHGDYFAKFSDVINFHATFWGQFPALWGLIRWQGQGHFRTQTSLKETICQQGPSWDSCVYAGTRENIWLSGKGAKRSILNRTSQLAHDSQTLRRWRYGEHRTLSGWWQSGHAKEVKWKHVMSVLQRSHVVHAVGEFDDQDSNILRRPCEDLQLCCTNFSVFVFRFILYLNSIECHSQQTCSALLNCPKW